MKTQGPYEARHCPGIPTDCCDFGIVSLSQGREVCRVWERDDAERLAAILNSKMLITDEMIERALAAWFASPPSETDQGLARSMRAALTAAL